MKVKIYAYDKHRKLVKIMAVDSETITDEELESVLEDAKGCIEPYVTSDEFRSIKETLVVVGK